MSHTYNYCPLNKTQTVKQKTKNNPWESWVRGTLSSVWCHWSQCVFYCDLRVCRDGLKRCWAHLWHYFCSCTCRMPCYRLRWLLRAGPAGLKPCIWEKISDEVKNAKTSFREKKFICLIQTVRVHRAAPRPESFWVSTRGRRSQAGQGLWAAQAAPPPCLPS